MCLSPGITFIDLLAIRRRAFVINVLDHLRQEFWEEHGPSIEPETLADSNGGEPHGAFEDSTGSVDNILPYCRGTGMEHHAYGCGLSEGSR